jgi:hypothetical protein
MHIELFVKCHQVLCCAYYPQQERQAGRHDFPSAARYTKAQTRLDAFCGIVFMPLVN